MIKYGLPTTITIDDNEYAINKNGDYRMVLDVICVLLDEELDDREKVCCSLSIFYDFNIPEDTQQALDKMMLFINQENEETESSNKKPLMDWEQDFDLLVAPINKIVGKEIRALEYFHWWSFLAAYMEIGECTFTNVVSIRRKMRDGKKIDKQEAKFYKENRKMIDLKRRFTREEQDFINSMMGLNN